MHLRSREDECVIINDITPHRTGAFMDSWHLGHKRHTADEIWAFELLFAFHYTLMHPLSLPNRYEVVKHALYAHLSYLLFSSINFYCNITMPIHFQGPVVHGYFCTAVTDLGTWERDTVGYKAPNIYHLAL